MYPKQIMFIEHLFSYIVITLLFIGTHVYSRNKIYVMVFCEVLPVGCLQFFTSIPGIDFLNKNI